MKKKIKLQISNFLNTNIILKNKTEISADVYYRDTNTHDDF